MDSRFHTNAAQQILALDAKYNTYRCQTNPNRRTLYLRRRTQILQERANDELLDPSRRREYLKVRQQILAKKYGLSETRSRTSSRQSASLQSHQSFDSLLLAVNDSPRGASPKTHRRQASSGSLSKLIDPEERMLHVVPTSAARASRFF